MTHEIDESIPYLNALRRSASSFAESTTLRASEAGADEHPPSGAFADSTDPFQGVEKRHSSRHKCDGSAELCEEGCQVGTWATFTDISLHGCYLDAKATYPVGTMLHLKLDANGVQVQAKGCVRVSYPYLGMGVALVDTSDDNRVRLRELLGTIAQSSTIVEPTPVPSTIVEQAIVEPTLVEPGTSGPSQTPPSIADPTAVAVLHALIEFFADRPVLTRDAFLLILRESQIAKP